MDPKEGKQNREEKTEISQNMLNHDTDEINQIRCNFYLLKQCHNKTIIRYQNTDRKTLT